MSSLRFDSSWIWHPNWTESPTSSSSGAFIDFRKDFFVDQVPTSPIKVNVSADTRYKLYINGTFIHAGPVKGDAQAWFFDELDVQPYLRSGTNHVAVRVLRFYYATNFATSFPRTPFGGLLIEHVSTKDGQHHGVDFHTDASWEAAIDHSTRLPNDTKHDFFLHVFEDIDRRLEQHPTWVPAAPYKFLTSFGLAIPWNLSPRLIPYPQLQPKFTKAVHNIQSTAPRDAWENVLLKQHATQPEAVISLPAGTVHHIELEFEHHTTGYLDFRFLRPSSAGSSLKVTYSECYEDEPRSLPGLRVKGDRCDTTKHLIGPQDRYVFGGHPSPGAALPRYGTQEEREVFSPFHFRTFRFIALDIRVAEDSDLDFGGIDITETRYPLQVISDFKVPAMRNDTMLAKALWDVSLRTLLNCMHDCYEDCPFYEQLQYAMDTRSSALFTYCVSRDDRLARQAILQLHNSFQPAHGLIASRAPSHHLQIIPHFSLFWICMLTDHYQYFGDPDFVSQFLPVSHAVLETYHRRIDAQLGLVRNFSSEYWNFVDWTEAWKPFGVPPAAQKTGFQTFTNSLYAYTLKQLATVLSGIGRGGLVSEYTARADAIVLAIQTHCFDGNYFTDGPAIQADSTDYSEHNQVWAVLCGAVTPETGRDLLDRSLTNVRSKAFSSPSDAQSGGPSADTTPPSTTLTPTSIAMSFYTLRALSLVGGKKYDAHFNLFWDPWRVQLAQNVTTWVEDSVSQRSDCHAWGSLPLYEFVTEVAGITPASAGWKAISFKPRLDLFRELDAKVAIGGPLGSGVAGVQWAMGEKEGTVRVVLSIEYTDGARAEEDTVLIPVRVTWPGGRSETVFGPGTVEFSVNVAEGP